MAALMSMTKAAGRSGRRWGSDMLTASQRVHQPGSSGLCSAAVTSHTTQVLSSLSQDKALSVTVALSAREQKVTPKLGCS